MDGPVIVVGAGFAGLSAAAALGERGVPTLVLEKRSLPGGRASSFRDPAVDGVVDLGPHVYFGCYQSTLRFLRLIGSEDRLRFQEAPEIPIRDPAGVAEQVLRLPKLPAPFHLLAGLWRLRGLGLRDRIATLGLLPALFSSKGRFEEPLDSYPAERWLDALRQTPALRRVIWGPFCRAAVNLPLQTASAALLKVAVDRCLLGGRGAASVGIVTAPAVSLLTPGIGEFLTDRKSELRLQSHVRRILFGQEGVTGVEMRDGSRLKTGTVVCAVPHGSVPRLMEPVPPRLAQTVISLRRLPSSPITTVHLWLDRPVMRFPFLSLIGFPFEWLFDYGVSPMEGGREAFHLAMLAGAGAIPHRIPTAELIHSAREVVAKALPASKEAAVLHVRIVRHPFATPAFAPGTNSLRPAVRTAVKGLYLAGDYVATGLPGTVESACVSGFAAAEAILADAP